MKLSEQREELNTTECEFEAAVEAIGNPNIWFLYLTDDDGPWMMGILTFKRTYSDGEVWITKILRLDFDEQGIRGGWSPYNLNGDDDIRAEYANVDTSPPDGISMSAAEHTIPELAQAAADWFQRHWDAWLEVKDLPPTRTNWLGRLLGQPEWRYPS